MMISMISEYGVTFKDLEKNILHGYASLDNSLQRSSWSDMTRFWCGNGIKRSIAIKEDSHVIKAIKVPNDYAKGTIRISLGNNNTAEDVETIVKAIGKICRNNEL